MTIELTANEARIIGCLMEKSVVTPEQYPLTLNALTNACNQKSAREPVLSLDPGVVQATVRSLQEKRLVRVEENFRTQVEKYTQRLCNTPFGDYNFDAPQFAIICVLLLRGPRTPGELRANSGRLHTFADNAAVVVALDSLIEREGGALVAELPRTAGRRDSEYAHLLSGPVAVRTTSGGLRRDDRPVREERVQESSSVAAPGSTIAAADLERRVAKLEAQVAKLQKLVEERG